MQRSYIASLHQPPVSSCTVRGALFVACLVALGCGSGSGTVADQPLLIPDVSDVSAGDPTCPAGGVRVRLGVDDNRDGDLDDDEVDTTSYVCNGTDMVGGEDDVLVRTVDLPLGDAECPAGGRRLDVGLDNGDGDGVADNDVLEDDEVDTSFLDCNGAMTVVVTPPTGTPGTFELDTHGGQGGTGNGGSAGSIREQADSDVVDAHLMIANTGSVDASCVVPTLALDLGAVPAEITANTTVAVVSSEDEVNLADGTIFMRAGDQRLYVWDVTTSAGLQASGLRVATGATATFAHNSPFSGLGVGLRFTRDVDVAGTITTVAASGQKGYLDISGRQVRFAATSSVDLRGANGDSSGRLVLNSNQDLLALGSIDTTGHSGTSGVSGGQVELYASGAIYTSGAIVTEGGDATAGNGGAGGRVGIEANTRLICNAADITTDGGQADGVAGQGGDIVFGDDCIYSSTVEIRNSGDLRARGGAQVGSCDETCAGGRGGSISFIAVQSGSVSSSGSIDTRGGNAEDANGGDGGQVNVRPGAFFESVPAISSYQFSGNITTFGGDGSANGGNGGTFFSHNEGALGSATRFLGYASALLDGGDGNGGSSAGSIVFAPDAESTTGGVGLYVYTNVSAVGGAGGDGNGGPGGYIDFIPDLDEVVRGGAPAENVVVTGTIDLSGGDGALGGHGGEIYAQSNCGPQLAATGIRVGGTITLDGGDGTDASAGRTGGLFLGTARGAVAVSGTIHAVGGESQNGVGGDFMGSSFFGAPVRFSASFTASGGDGSDQGGGTEDIAVISVGSSSAVTGTITLAAGSGPTAATGGRLGAVRIDTGSTCVSPP